MNTERLGTAAGLGAVSGLRSMMGMAMVSRELSGRRRMPRNASVLEEWLSKDLVALTLSGLALGEVVGDKLPATPPRIEPVPLLGRGVMGGLLGAIAMGSDDRAVGALVGAAAAVAASYAAWFVRREVVRATQVPDPALAVAEDAMAIVAGHELAKEL